MKLNESILRNLIDKYDGKVFDGDPKGELTSQKISVCFNNCKKVSEFIKKVTLIAKIVPDEKGKLYTKRVVKTGEFWRNKNFIDPVTKLGQENAEKKIRIYSVRLDPTTAFKGDSNG